MYKTQTDLFNMGKSAFNLHHQPQQEQLDTLNHHDSSYYTTLLNSPVEADFNGLVLEFYTSRSLSWTSVSVWSSGEYP